jgi:hypothetical protein
VPDNLAVDEFVADHARPVARSRPRSGPTREACGRRTASALAVTPTREHLQEIARVADGALLPRSR